MFYYSIYFSFYLIVLFIFEWLLGDDIFSVLDLYSVMNDVGTGKGPPRRLESKRGFYYLYKE